MRNLFFREENRYGFTLIELLIVVAILGILAGIAVPLFIGQRTKAAMSEARSNLEALRLLEEQYFAENGEYIAGADTGAIQNALPGFKPGNTDQLKFDYVITTAAGNSEFTITATGKSGTLVESNQITLDHDNEWGP